MCKIALSKQKSSQAIRLLAWLNIYSTTVNKKGGERK